MGQHRATRFSLGLGLATLFLAAQVPAFADWPTYHKDAARTGADSTAPALTSATQQWAHTGLDRNVHAEPLVCGTMVLVATQGDASNALDAATGNLHRPRNYGIAVPANQLPRGHINPVRT